MRPIPVGAANGTLVAPNGGAAATINNGLFLPGNAGGGNGVSGYVALPDGIVKGYSSVSVECWVQPRFRQHLGGNLGLWIEWLGQLRVDSRQPRPGQHARGLYAERRRAGYYGSDISEFRSGAVYCRDLQ